MEINKTTLGIAAGVAGTLFLGYCIYFDHKRRSDPEYKKKVRERRRKAKKAAAGRRPEIPNLVDKDAVQRFFLQEIQMGEMLISSGHIEQGVEHLASAVVVCGQPTQLLQVLQQTLPAQVFTLLIHKMKEYGNKMEQQAKEGQVEELTDDLE
ncbi:mitochondrial import receptor subunit TOM20 homolog [Lutzomyia longipalpis]|uniref:Putative translocase of outer membrane complex subunit tom20 n=1 Tax=Lutzomyia longipalpis TaxID=7200 RepID=A0A7G3AWL1_LUTLO|nr:mitochondrial import receptor subunit TOM20 homolog [Lutzomyia longipalpis]